MGIPYSLFGYRVNLKRIWDSSSSNQNCMDENDEVQPPVRKRLKTVDYIYEHLFVNGEGSDVVIKTLGCEWKLHRVYLAQSPYFASMFSGKWRESNFDQVSVDFPDPRITADSLTTIFGSLYKDSIDIEVTKVISLVATAAALQLEHVVQQCGEVMIGNISVKMVHSYYAASRDYGLTKVQEHCIQWLLWNLLFFSKNPRFLRKISPTLMAVLIRHPGLFVVQGEMDIYWLLKKWMYVRCCRAAVKEETELKQASDEYFSNLCSGKESFLESTRGVPFVPVFAGLRLSHILTSIKSYQIVNEDNIVPKDIIERVMAAQWQQQLDLYGDDKKRDDNATLDEEAFHRRAVRCGRILQDDNTACWRWTGYFFGVDLLLCCKHRVLSIKRNYNHQTPPYPVDSKNERKICYRLSVIRFNDKRQQTWSYDSGIKWVTLKLDESIVAAPIPSGIQFPLTIIFNFITAPYADDFAETALASSWEKYAVDCSSDDDEESLDDDYVEFGQETESIDSS